MRPGFEVGSRTVTNVPVISVIHRVRPNPEIKMVMPKGGGIDPGGRADPISPNLLIGFAARCSLHNLYKFSLTTVKPRFKQSQFKGFPLFKEQISADRFSLKYINYPDLSIEPGPSIVNHKLLLQAIPNFSLK